MIYKKCFFCKCNMVSLDHQGFNTKNVKLHLQYSLVGNWQYHLLHQQCFFIFLIVLTLAVGRVHYYFYICQLECIYQYVCFLISEVHLGLFGGCLGLYIRCMKQTEMEDGVYMNTNTSISGKNPYTIGTYISTSKQPIKDQIC